MKTRSVLKRLGNFRIVQVENNSQKKHYVIPENAREWIDEEMKLVGKPHIIGWLFECDCKSTLFVPKRLVLLDKEVS